MKYFDLLKKDIMKAETPEELSEALNYWRCIKFECMGVDDRCRNKKNRCIDCYHEWLNTEIEEV